MGLKVKAHRGMSPERKNPLLYTGPIIPHWLLPLCPLCPLTSPQWLVTLMFLYDSQSLRPTLPTWLSKRCLAYPLNWEGPSSPLTGPLHPRALFLSPLAFIHSLSLSSGSEEGMPKGMLTWADDRISPSDLLPRVISPLGGSLVLSYSSSSFL